MKLRPIRSFVFLRAKWHPVFHEPIPVRLCVLLSAQPIAQLYFQKSWPDEKANHF